MDGQKEGTWQERGASRTMHHGCTPRGASRYISHRERAPTAGAKLSLCHKVSRKRGCSRGQTIRPRAKASLREERTPAVSDATTREGEGQRDEEERAYIQIYGNARPLCTGLSICRSLRVVTPIINITIVAIFAGRLAALLRRLAGGEGEGLRNDLVFRRGTGFFRRDFRLVSGLSLWSRDLSAFVLLFYAVASAAHALSWKPMLRLPNEIYIVIRRFRAVCGICW